MIARLTLCTAALLVSGTARAELRLLEEPLRLSLEEPVRRAADAPAAPLLALAAAAQPADAEWDLLGAPKEPPPPSDAPAMRRRRWMLKTHQALGLGLAAAQIANTTVGQLNYSDKFAKGPNTGRWREAHSALAWTNLGLFAVTGAFAMLAPEPKGFGRSGFDRVKLHKVALYTALAGMAAQGALGVYTARREGFENQEGIATAHLAIGYVTLAAIATGVGAIVY